MRVEEAVAGQVAPAEEAREGSGGETPPSAAHRLSRWFPQPAVSVVLLLVWLALVNSLHPRMLFLGALWAWAVPLFTHAFFPSRPHIRSWGTLLRFLPVFLWDVVVANLAVAWLIVNLRRRVRPAWIVIPLELSDPYAITTLANVISLTPGTVSAELGPGRRTLLVHSLDVVDPAAQVARIKTRYEAPIREIFER